MQLQTWLHSVVDWLHLIVTLSPFWQSSHFEEGNSLDTTNIVGSIIDSVHFYISACLCRHTIAIVFSILNNMNGFVTVSRNLLFNSVWHVNTVIKGGYNRERKTSSPSLNNGKSCSHTWNDKWRQSMGDGCWNTHHLMLWNQWPLWSESESWNRWIGKRMLLTKERQGNSVLQFNEALPGFSRRSALIWEEVLQNETTNSADYTKLSNFTTASLA